MRIDNRSSPANGKAIDMERVRNNQRRCRARRKEYIAGLEDKIRQHEGMSVESTVKKKLEDLAAENRSLKRLLQLLGLHDEFLDAYSNAVRIAPDFSWPLLGDYQFAGFSDHPAPNPSLNRLEPHLSPTAVHQEQFHHPVGQFEDVPNSDRSAPNLSQTNASLQWELSNLASTSASSHMEQFDQLTMDALMTKAFSNAVTEDDVSDTTTLCSWAFSLILKSNLKGYSAADLDLKLRAGYRHGSTPTEGCRIDNKVLLNVLADVM